MRKRRLRSPRLKPAWMARCRSNMARNPTVCPRTTRFGKPGLPPVATSNRPPLRDYPIAGRVNTSITYDYLLDCASPASSCPATAPHVLYSWSIPGTGLNAGNAGPLDGWSGSFEVTSPDKVGKYTLEVTLQIELDGEVFTEHRSHTLYMLWNSPIEPPDLTWTMKLRRTRRGHRASGSSVPPAGPRARTPPWGFWMPSISAFTTIPAGVTAPAARLVLCH